MDRTVRLVAVALGSALLAASSLQAQNADVPRTPTPPGIGNPAFPYAQPEEVGLSSETLSGLGDEIADWVSDDFIVGAEVLIIKDGHAVFHESYGWSDREEGRPMERGSIFRIRSMTKPILGTAVLLLVEEGRLSLDDPAAQYLPSFDTDRARSITIRQLLTHTSGLGDHGFGDIGLERSPEAYPTLRALVDEIGEIGPLLPSGEFKYSDSGSATLGALVAEVSGMPLERFIETHILAPLGMADTHTRFTPDAPWADRMNSTYRLSREACGFERYWDPTMAQEYPYFRASGGIYSTTMDYARFMAMWMNKGRLGDVRLLSEETVESALSPYSGEGEGRHYGMHWRIRNEHMVDGMPAVFGHGGSDGTLAYAMPELDAIALYFTQSRASPSREHFLAQLGQIPPFDAYVAGLWNGEVDAQWEAIRTRASGTDPSEGRPVVVPAELLERYAGTYRVERGAEHVLAVEGNALRSSFPRTAEGSLLLPLSSSVFLTQDPCTGTVYRFTFEVGTDGTVRGYRIDSNDGRSVIFQRQH